MLFMSCVNRSEPVGVVVGVGRREGGVTWQELVPVGVWLCVNQQRGRAQRGRTTGTPTHGSAVPAWDHHW